MTHSKSLVNLSTTLFMCCLFAVGCNQGGGNTNNTSSNSNTTSTTGNQGGAGKSPSPTTNGAPRNISVQPSPERGPVWHPTWLQTASAQGGANGQQFIFTCPPYPKGRPAPVTGTDVYTIGSSICTAAVHAGIITLDQGGPVTFEIRPGQSSYVGSTRNGVTSTSSGALSGTMNWSFVFIKP